ncbi:hypothetical protein [Falsigemmobacter faecalis]|uniref:hypothetical protein n=1 Tax=Falsigemmobacter faecalis TaxID=2488730 RepID=UPI001F336507|nr:hypothetical protein [Falsigemmobacter faecalis]
MRKIALIGAGITGSRSPALHMAEARAQGFGLDDALIDLQARGLTAAALPNLLAEAEAAGLAGVNITPPCKQQVPAHLPRCPRPGCGQHGGLSGRQTHRA